MNRYGWRDEQWKRIEPLLPGKKGDPGATAKDNRLFVEAVLYPSSITLESIASNIKMTVAFDFT